MAKKVVKKRVTKKSNPKNPEVDIKIRNIDKVLECESKKSKCGCRCSHFWIFGSMLAITLSYERSASILRAIIHGILSWFYILFRAMQIWGWF